MDPVTHAVVGRMVAGLARPALSRSTAVLAAGAGLAPDVDAILMPIGWDIYLRVHEAGTHTILGGLAVAVVAAAVWRAYSRDSFGPLLLASVAGVSSHIVLDALSGATIKPLWPLNDSRTALGLVAMADPFVVAPVVAMAVLAAVRRSSLQRFAAVTIITLTVVLLGKAVSRQMAITAYQQHVDGSPTNVELHARWGSLWHWWVYDRTEDRVRAWDVDAWGGHSTRVLDRPRAGLEDMVTGEAGLATVRNFLRAHDFPVRVLMERDHVVSVFWSDLRFCFPLQTGGGPAVGTRVRPSVEPLACGLWFGGDLDARGDVLRQFVTIGNYLQRR